MRVELQKERKVVGQCSICGRVRDLIALPGRPEKFCLECSADVAAAVQLTAEIGAAVREGLQPTWLESELSEVGRRMLERAQSAGLQDI